MKPNTPLVSIELLQEIEIRYLLNWIEQPDLWKTLDIDYHTPRVERLYLDFVSGSTNFRLYLHVIHATDETCLFHKHNWPSVIKIVSGSYEMGLTYSENEVSSKDAHTMPVLSKLILNYGSYYEMTQTDAMHYVKPVKPVNNKNAGLSTFANSDNVSYSIMLTAGKYDEHVFRKEALDKELKPLTNVRKKEILARFRVNIQLDDYIRRGYVQTTEEREDLINRAYGNDISL